MADFKWLSCFEQFPECSGWNFQQLLKWAHAQHGLQLCDVYVWMYLEGTEDLGECMADVQMPNCTSIFDPEPKKNP